MKNSNELINELDNMNINSNNMNNDSSDNEWEIVQNIPSKEEE